MVQETLPLHLFPDDQVFVSRLIVGAVPEFISQEPGHFILIKILLTGIALIVIIIGIKVTFLADSCGGFFIDLIDAKPFISPRKCL